MPRLYRLRSWPRLRALAQMRPTQPRQSESNAPLTKLSPKKQMRICAMSRLQIRTKKGTGNFRPRSLPIPFCLLLVEDPHHDSPQEHEDETDGKQLKLPRHATSSSRSKSVCLNCNDLSKR